MEKMLDYFTNMVSISIFQEWDELECPTITLNAPTLNEKMI